MNGDKDMSEQVRKVYDRIAESEGEESCCGSAKTSTTEDSCCGSSEPETEGIQPSYESVEGHEPEADLGLGCGIPLREGDLEAGETVLDLGSGAGHDCFVARRGVGESGRVIGVDFSPEMLDKARENARELGFDNVEFHQGQIEDLPVESDTVDVVISNCVLNLVPDKQAAFGEIKRVLKPGGYFSVSDVVVGEELPEVLRRDRELVAGCLVGAIRREAYLDLIREVGFELIRVIDEREITFGEATLEKYAEDADENSFESADVDPAEIDTLSLTVRATKP